MKAEAVTVESPARAQAPVLVQRKCACSSSALTGECQDCKKTKSIQRKVGADRQENISAPPLVSQVLRSAGRPLDDETRAFMEPRFGHDFSRVRVYTDGTAAKSAQAVNALAYTVGQSVVFDAGQYSPQTNEGRRLIAHELAHTLQQATSAPLPSAPLAVGSSGDPAEGEADRVADRVMTGVDHQPVTSNAAGDAGPALFRKPKTPASKAPAHLHACDTTTEMPKINKAAAAAKVSATNAVQGLQDLLSIWGTAPTTTSQRSAARALARGFNMEFDKTDWVTMGIATAAEVATLDTRDHDATKTILTNFKQIEADLPNYTGAPGCNLSTGQLTLGTPCFGCADTEYTRCKETMLKGPTVAFILERGIPSSPIFFCPEFFTGTDIDPGDAVLHEVAHLQNFSASDIIGTSSYYGCPVYPTAQFAPGLTDPADFIQIADSYRCFVVTQREATAAFTEAEKSKKESEKVIRDILKP